jgi:membrane-associated protease RseP (regulator of RpoE activity)
MGSSPALGSDGSALSGGPADRASRFEAPFAVARERYWLCGLLFALTMLSATVVGTAMQIDFDHNLPFDLERSIDTWVAVWRTPALLFRGLPFSLTLLIILLAHEFGHYLAASFHRVDASLPYFLPSPFLGTFGAFIRVRSPIYSKRALFDIGIAGPLAGFVFLAPALAIGLAFSKVIPGIAHQGTLHFGVPLLERLLQSVIFPGVPVGDLYLHPIARAAWIGTFMTALNLLPIGQLDGGHILYSFFPNGHKLVSRGLCIALLPLGKFWPGWTVWGLILLWLGRRHPVVEDPAMLSLDRRRLGYAALLVFAICICLVPFGNAF